MSPAEHVIAKFGGVTALARMLGKGQTTVSYWKKTGTIPGKWHSAIMNAGRQNGIAITTDDLAVTEVARARRAWPAFRPEMSRFWGACLFTLSVAAAAFCAGLWMQKPTNGTSNSAVPVQTGQIAAANIGKLAPARANAPSSAHTDPAAAGKWFVYAAHGNWQTRCRSGVAAATMKSMCVGLLEILENKSHQRIVTWVIGHNLAGGYVESLQIPSGVDISHGLKLTLDGGNSWDFNFSSCEPSGCVVNTALAPGLLQATQSASAAHITVSNTSGHVLTFNVPIGGIKQTLHDLQ